MKVLYFHQHFSTIEGSAGTRSYAMAKRLIYHGHKVTMVCGSYSGGNTGLTGQFVRGVRRGTVDGIDVVELELNYANSHGFARRSWTFLQFALRSIWLAIREPYDVVFATTTPLTASLPGIAARWLRAKPFVFEVRDLWPELPRAMGVIRNPAVLTAMSLLERASYQSANRLVALSPGIMDGIAKRGVPLDNIEMIPNGCDMDLFGTAAAPWRPPGVGDSVFLAVFAGTHGNANGLDAVLDAAAVLQRRGRTEIKLMLIGDGKLKPKLVARVERECLTNVVFHSPIRKTDLAGLLAASDMGLQILANVPAFYFGTSPNKFFDYLAAGLPVLINYPGWLAELVHEHNCGFAVPPEDPVAFANALELAASDRVATKGMGVRGRELGMQEFERNLLADRWVDCVEEVAAQGRGAGWRLREAVN